MTDEPDESDPSLWVQGVVGGVRKPEPRISLRRHEVGFLLALSMATGHGSEFDPETERIVVRVLREHHQACRGVAKAERQRMVRRKGAAD